MKSLSLSPRKPKGKTSDVKSFKTDFDQTENFFQRVSRSRCSFVLNAAINKTAIILTEKMSQPFLGIVQYFPWDPHFFSFHFRCLEKQNRPQENVRCCQFHDWHSIFRRRSNDLQKLRCPIGFRLLKEHQR